MCRTAREAGGFTAWINLKAPPQDLDCFDLVVEGDCETVAMHVSSWWLKECPRVLSDTQIQNLQEKCKMFIARSTEAALNRALAEVDDDSLSKILRQQENKSRVLNVKEGGEVVFISAERSQRSGLSTWKAVNHDVQTVSQTRKNPSPAPTSTLSMQYLRLVGIRLPHGHLHNLRVQTSCRSFQIVGRWRCQRD